MNDLGGALRELAREAQAPAPVDPGELWTRGRRRVRRRRIAVAVTAVVVAVLGSLAVVRPEPRVVMPAGSPHAPAIPKNIYEPNRFLAGVSGEGPPGRLAVIALDRRDEWFGISATTGAYRHLDLPHRAEETSIALSPDGRRVAYWATSATSDRTYQGAPVAVAIYDTVNGSLRRHDVASEHGLRPGEAPELFWMDSTSLTASFGFLRDQPGLSGDHAIYRWDLRDGSFVRAAPDDRWWGRFRNPDGTQIGLKAEGDQLPLQIEEVSAALRPTRTLASLPSGNYDNVSINGNRVLVTGIEGDSGIQRLRSGIIARAAVVDLSPVGGDLVITELLGWRSSNRVLVAAVDGERHHNDEIVDPPDVTQEDLTDEDRGLGMNYHGETLPPWHLFEIDLRDGSVTRLGVSTQGQSVYVAQDLVEDPMVHGRKPPSLFDVFWVPCAIGLGVLAAGGAAWFLVRRRRRG